MIAFEPLAWTLPGELSTVDSERGIVNNTRLIVESIPRSTWL